MAKVTSSKVQRSRALTIGTRNPRGYVYPEQVPVVRNPRGYVYPSQIRSTSSEDFGVRHLGDPAFIPGYRTKAADITDVPKPGYGTGGGDVGGDVGGEGTIGYQQPDVHWVEGSYGVKSPNTPAWWKPYVPSDLSQSNRPDVALSLMLNTMIPYMSPEDQVRAAQQMYLMWDTDLSGYKPYAGLNPTPGVGVAYPNPAPLLPESIARGIEGPAVANADYFMSGERAAQAINALNNMREATVGGDRWKLGPGYKWLQEVLGAMQNYGGGRSRQEQLSMFGALDPLMSQAGSGDLSAFGGIGKMLMSPFFSRGQLRPTSKTQAGNYLFGQYNPLLSW